MEKGGLLLLSLLFCCFFKAAGSSVEIEAFPLFYYSRRRRRRHSFSFFGFGKALCLETTFAISQLLPTHQGNFRNLLSLASSFLCKLATVNCSLGKLRCIVYAKDEKYAVLRTYLPWEIKNNTIWSTSDFYPRKTSISCR